MHSPTLTLYLFLLYPWLRHVITSNPLRFFSVIMHSPTFMLFIFCYTHGFAVHNTSNPLRFFSVIMHSPNTFSFFCKQKAESIWLIAYNKKSLSNRLLYLKGFFSEQVVPLVIPQLHYYFVYTSYGKPVSY